VGESVRLGVGVCDAVTVAVAVAVLVAVAVAVFEGVIVAVAVAVGSGARALHAESRSAAARRTAACKTLGVVNTFRGVGGRYNLTRSRVARPARHEKLVAFGIGITLLMHRISVLRGFVTEVMTTVIARKAISAAFNGAADEAIY
jgi:hypothetical protein